MAFPEGLEEGKVVVLRQVRCPDVPANSCGQVCRQPGKEGLVVVVYDPVLSPVVDGEGSAHPGASEPPEDIFTFLHHSLRRSAWMVVHHRGRAGLDHLDGGVLGDQAPVNGAASPALHDPGLQAAVDSPHLEGGNAATVVVRVGKPRHNQKARAPDDFIHLAVLQVVERSHRLNHSVALQNGAVGNYSTLRRAGSSLADNVSSPNQRRCHAVLQPG